MATWSDLSAECARDARRAKEAGSHRAALNRAYYAVFGAVSRAAQTASYTFPVGYEGPTHEAVHGGNIVAYHLRAWLDPQEQSRLIFLLALLYKLRCMADYSPASTVNEHDARLAIGRMFDTLLILEKVP